MTSNYIVCLLYILIDKWCKMYQSVEKQTSAVTTEWRIFIFICLFVAFLIKMIFVNNGLRSTDIVNNNIFNNYIFLILNEYLGIIIYLSALCLPFGDCSQES